MSQLQNGRYEGSEGWKYITVSPGISPLNELSTTLQREKVIDSFATFEKEMREDASGNYLGSIAKVYGRKIVLFVDQFEEVITQCKEETERKLFLLNLTKAAEGGRMLILLTLRSDYYAAFADYPAFKDKLESSNYTLAAIDADKEKSDNDYQVLKDVIQQPALLHGVTFEEGLVERLVQETIPLTGALPLLQLTLYKLWKPGIIENGEITLSEFNTVANAKGIEGIIETHAGEVYEKLCPEGAGSDKSALFRDLLLQLVELSESHEDVRRTVEKRKLIANLWAYRQDETERMINELAGEESRLLKVSARKDGKVYVDIVHEVLIRKWGRLKEWIDENRKALNEKEKLEAAAAHFATAQYDYYRGRKLKEAIRWQQAHKNLSTETINGFISQSQTKIRRSWIRRGAAAAACLLLFFLVKPIYDDLQMEYKCKHSQLYNDALKAYGTDSNEKITRLPLSGFIVDQLDYCNCFPNLDSVDLTGTFDIKILPSYPALQTIHYLGLHGNDSLFSDSYISALKELKNLTTLDLSGNNITNIDSLKELKNLTTLDLSGNNLTNIDSLKKLKNLTTLNLSDNNLTNIECAEGVEEPDHSGFEL